MDSLNELKDAFREEKLEELLVANWTQFLDSFKLLRFVLQNVKANTNRLAIISQSEIKSKGSSITLSRCHWSKAGFVIWIEFHVPRASNQAAEGTMEANLSCNGSITHINTIGNIFCA